MVPLKNLARKGLLSFPQMYVYEATERIWATVADAEPQKYNSEKRWFFQFYDDKIHY